MAGTLTIGGLAMGLLTGEKIIGPQTMTGAATVGQVTDLALTAGDNTIVIPAGATAVYIALPPSNVVTVKIRSNLNASDGGLPVGPAGFCVFPFPAGTTQLILNAASSTASLEATFI